EPCRNSSRAHEVADHYGEVTSFGSSQPGLASPGMPFDSARDQGTGRIGLQSVNSFDEPLSVTQRYPELLEIGFRQICKHIGVDRVLGERWLIACEAQVAQPVANFHTDIPTYSFVSSFCLQSVSTPEHWGEIPISTASKEALDIGVFCSSRTRHRIDRARTS